MRMLLKMVLVTTVVVCSQSQMGIADTWFHSFNPGADLSAFTVVNPTGVPTISLDTTPGTLHMLTPARFGGSFNGYDLAQQVNYDAMRMFRGGGGEPFTLETRFTTASSGSSQHTRLSGLYLISDNGNFFDDLVFGASGNSLKMDRGNGSASIAPWLGIGDYPQGLELQVIHDGVGNYDFNYKKTGDAGWSDYVNLTGFSFNGMGLFTKTWKEISAPASPEVVANFDYLAYNIPEPTTVGLAWWVVIASVAYGALRRR